MTPRFSLGRDTAILLLVFVGGLAVMAVAPPASTPSPATGVAQANRRTPAPSTAAATPTPASTSSGGGTTGTATQGQQTPRVKLMATKYARYAHLISGPSLSSGEKRALDGFDWNRTTINSTAVRITLIPTEPRYHRYSVVVRKRQKLYFIETSFGDDAPHRETQLNDDAPVKVDNNGYVIQ